MEKKPQHFTKGVHHLLLRTLNNSPSRKPRNKPKIDSNRRGIWQIEKKPQHFTKGEHHLLLRTLNNSPSRKPRNKPKIDSNRCGIWQIEKKPQHFTKGEHHILWYVYVLVFGGHWLMKSNRTIMLATALVSLLGTAAVAKPPFAEKEGVSCKYCHSQPPMRNYRGNFYHDNNLSFAGFDDAAEAKKAGVEVGPEASSKPKSWTAPEAPAEPAKPTAPAKPAPAKPGKKAPAKPAKPAKKGGKG
jgi:hypothetical protein